MERIETLQAEIERLRGQLEWARSLMRPIVEVARAIAKHPYQDHDCIFSLQTDSGTVRLFVTDLKRIERFVADMGDHDSLRDIERALADDQAPGDRH